jgi:hypothetical protein
MSHLLDLFLVCLRVFVEAIFPQRRWDDLGPEKDNGFGDYKRELDQEYC